jgi:hypothetical protein
VRRLLVAAILIGLCPFPVDAQGTGPAVVRVRVADTTGAPLPGAQLVLLRGGKETVLQAIADPAGRYSFSFTPEGARYQLVVRKVGYVQTARLVPVAAGDTLTVAVALAPLPPGLPALDTVRVTGARGIPKAYYINADEIAHSTRGLFDAWDVVRKLRPDMITDKDRCPGEGLKYIWVNGQRLPDDDVPAPPPPPPSPQRRSGSGRGGRGGGSGRPLPTPSVGAQPAEPGSVIAMINPEHIAEVRYLDCWDTSVPGIGGQRALFVTLKPGISFDRKRGSYVDSTVVRPPNPSSGAVDRGGWSR